MRIALLATVFLAFSLPCAADPTLSIWADDDGTLVNMFDVTEAEPFDIVFVLDSDGHGVRALEFVADDLTGLVPGIFKIGSSSSAPVHLDPVGCGVGARSTCGPGEVLVVYYDCHLSSDSLELLRWTYGDFSGVMTSDVVITLRGFGPGDSFPSSIGGEPGFLDCEDVPIAAPMGGSDGGVTDSGVMWPDGSLILNPCCVPLPVEDSSFAALKSRY